MIAVKDESRSHRHPCPRVRAMLISAAALVAVAVVAPGARAATVGWAGNPESFILFSAEPGELNLVTVSMAGPSQLRIEDRGAVLAAGARCIPTQDLHVVTCAAEPPPGVSSIDVWANLADRDDTISYTGLTDPRVHGVVLAGPGDDVVLGGPGRDSLDGQGGSDRLEGGPGRDFLMGDSYSDWLPPAPAATQNDDLRGGPGNDDLQGGEGDDRLRGGPGNDFFAGDSLRGEGAVPASDAPATLPQRPDLIRGGPGNDSALFANSEAGDPAPTLTITFDGRANDGRGGERDNIARGLELAYSSTETQLEGGGGGTMVGGPARVYRLSQRGTEGGESAFLMGGRFRVRMRARGRFRTRGSPTDIELPDSGFDGCDGPSRRVIRRLRTDVDGRFRVRGRRSSATVRGTKFITVDRCDGTLTKVFEGKVVVRNRFRPERALVLSGGNFLARVAGRSRCRRPRCRRLGIVAHDSSPVANRVP